MISLIGLSLASAALSYQNADSIRLSQVCGNRFAIQNTHDFAAEVKWAVAGTADSGLLTVPARTPTQAYREVYVTTSLSGVTKVFYKGRLVDTSVNVRTACGAGHVVPPVAPASVSMALLESLGIYVDRRDNRYRRDMLIVEFKRNTEQSQRQAAIDLVRGVVIGGRRWRSSEGSYYVRVAPTESIEDLARLVLELLRLSYVGGARLANMDPMSDNNT